MDDLEALEELCSQMNTNISPLQTIVGALQDNDYISSIAPVVEGEDTVGYVINFTQSGSVTIYHGEDGINGQNGLDGHTPVIGVALDSDGLYYQGQTVMKTLTFEEGVLTVGQTAVKQEVIEFADPLVKQILTRSTDPLIDTDHDGEISHSEAERALTMPTFQGTMIKSFDELRYFL